MSDRVTQAVTQDLPPSVLNSYRARADRSGVPHTTLYARDHGRPSMKQKAEKQQYLAPWEENAVVKYLLQMSDLGQPVRIKYIPQIAFSVTHQRPVADRPPKPPGKNWAKGLEKRHPELKAKRVKALDWNRHEKNTYGKITHWFEVIGSVLQDPNVDPKNVFNMDETGVMLVGSQITCDCLIGSNGYCHVYRNTQLPRCYNTKPVSYFQLCSVCRALPRSL